MTTPCRAVGRLVESFLDGELDPSQVLEVEKHTQSCVTCRERVALDGAIRAGVRGVVAASNPSPNLRARVSASMVAQRWAVESASGSSALSTWGAWIVGLAAAVAAVVGIQGRGRQQDAEDAARVREASVGTHVGLDAMLDQFVDWHARPLPPEITNPKDLPGFEPYVGVPVHAPALARIGARLLGGRILPVQKQHVAAMLQYTLDGGHRISIYVYDPRRVDAPPSKLRTKVIGTEPVYVGRLRGWSIAAAERRGVGYAVASDLDDEESAELALAAAP